MFQTYENYSSIAIGIFAALQKSILAVDGK